MRPPRFETRAFRAVVAIIAIAAAAWSPSVLAREPRAPSPNEERAMQLFQEAQKAYERGDYGPAIDKLKEAIALDPEGKELVYNLALIYEKRGDLEDAERMYRSYLAMLDDAKERDRVQAILKRLEGAKKDREARKEAPPAPAPIVPAASRTPPPPPRPPEHARVSPLVYALAGTGAAAFVIGGGFAISALAKKPGDKATTGNGVTYADLQEQAASAHRHAIVADISFALAAASAGAAVYLALSARKPSATHPSAVVTVGPARAHVEVRF
jgi:tetratricopeptide (TPR) repeat protein